MKIVNIDASEKSVQKVVHSLDFILEVVDSLRHEIVISAAQQMKMCPYHCNGANLPLSSIRKFEVEGYENVYNLLHTIPIYLLKDAKKPNEKDKVDPLGAYFPNTVNDAPYIELYVDDIDKTTNGEDEKFMWLLTKVLLHELAHAALDIYNCECSHNATEKVPYYSQFGKWREESMANAVALRIIKNYGNPNFYDYAESFMLNQPTEYALGVQMVEFSNMDFRSVIEEKLSGVNSTLQQKWLDYVKTQPTWSELKRWNEILPISTVYEYNKYNNRYYTDQQDLVLDIIKDYIAQQGSISFSQLCSVFPNVKVQDKDAYRPLKSVLNDSQYFTELNQVLQLTDGDYCVYKYWYNEDLENFLAIAQKQNFIVTKIKNY